MSIYLEQNLENISKIDHAVGLNVNLNKVKKPGAQFICRNYFHPCFLED